MTLTDLVVCLVAFAFWAAATTNTLELIAKAPRWAARKMRKWLRR